MPFERFASCFSNPLIPFERFASCFSNPLVPLERFASCFSKLPFERLASCFSNPLALPSAVCFLFLKSSSLFPAVCFLLVPFERFASCFSNAPVPLLVVVAAAFAASMRLAWPGIVALCRTGKGRKCVCKLLEPRASEGLVSRCREARARARDSARTSVARPKLGACGRSRPKEPQLLPTSTLRTLAPGCWSNSFPRK